MWVAGISAAMIGLTTYRTMMNQRKPMNRMKRMANRAVDAIEDMKLR